MTSHADTKMIAPNTTGCIELVVRPRRFRQDGAFPTSTAMTALGFYHTHAKHWLEHHPIMSMAESRVDEETIRFVFRWEPGDSLSVDDLPLLRYALPVHPDDLTTPVSETRLLREGRTIAAEDLIRFHRELESDTVGAMLTLWFGVPDPRPCPICLCGGSRVERNGDQYLCSVYGTVLTPNGLTSAMLHDNVPSTVETQTSSRRKKTSSWNTKPRGVCR